MRFPSPFHLHLPSHYTNARPVPAFLGYWLAPFCAIVRTEHFLFRRSYSAYDVFAAWNVPTHPDLPHWWPSLATFAVAVGIIVLCMEQAWWTGPIAARGTGDIGMVAGLTDIEIGETIAARPEQEALPAISIDEPTIALSFLVNN